MLIKCIAAAAIIITSAANAFASSDSDHNLISVTGRGEVKIVPDEVIVSFTIEKTDKNLKQAQKQNDDIANKVLRIMKNKLSIEDKFIQTNLINVSPVYSYVRCNSRQLNTQNENCNKQVFSHFLTQKGFTIKLKDTEKLQTLLEDIIDTGVTHVNNISFASSKFDSLKQQAELIAAKDAKKRAQAVAQSIGVSIDKPYRITVDQNSRSPYPQYGQVMKNSYAMSSEAAAQGDTIATGQLTVKATVQAQFIID